MVSPTLSSTQWARAPSTCGSPKRNTTRSQLCDGFNIAKYSLLSLTSFFLFLLCSKISNSLFGYLSLSLQVLRWRKAVRLLYHRYQCYRCPDLVSLSLSAGVRYELTGLVCVKGKRCVCPASPICFPIYPSVCKSVHLTRFHSGTQITQRLLPAQQVHVHRDHLTHHHRQTRAALHLARLLSARDAQSRAGRRRALRGPLRHMLRPGRPDPARGDGQVGQPPRCRLARV